MNNIIIKRVTPNEIKQLQKIAMQTFFEAFSAGNTTENMEKYLQERFSVQQLTKELNNPSSEFHLATVENTVIGYLKLNFEVSQTAAQDQSALEIERIYVSKDFHGKKVGQLLFEKAIERAHETNAAYIWLGVWEENHRAINFYKKNGFVAFDKHIFKLGDDDQTDLMMKLVLIKS